MDEFLNCFYWKMSVGIVIVVEILKNTLNLHAYINPKWVVLAVGILGAVSRWVGLRDLDFLKFVTTLAMALFIHNFIAKPCLDLYKKRHPLDP